MQINPRHNGVLSPVSLWVLAFPLRFPFSLLKVSTDKNRKSCQFLGKATTENFFWTLHAYLVTTRVNLICRRRDEKIISLKSAFKNTFSRPRLIEWLHPRVF